MSFLMAFSSSTDALTVDGFFLIVTTTGDAVEGCEGAVTAATAEIAAAAAESDVDILLGSVPEDNELSCSLSVASGENE